MRILVIILCSALVLAVPVRSQSPLPASDELVRPLIVRGIHLSLRQQYTDAQQVFEEAVEKAPFHPAGYLFQAGLLQTKAVDFHAVVERDRFDSLLDVSGRIADQWILEPERRALGYFYRGTIEGYRSYAASTVGSWLEALTKGLSAVGDLRRAVDLDPLLYDAYAGIGTYSYWKSRKLEFLTWLPILSDDREEGMRLLRLNMEKGIYHKVVALNSLAEIYLDAGRNQEALRLVRLVLRDYPGNRVFRWLEGRALEREGLASEAALTWGGLLQEYTELLGSASYPVLVCRIKLARAYLGLDKASAAREQMVLARRLLESEFPRHLRSKASDRRSELEQLEIQLDRRPTGSR